MPLEECCRRDHYHVPLHRVRWVSEERKTRNVKHGDPRQQCMMLIMVNQTEVQWKGLTLGEPPKSLLCLLYEVGLLDYGRSPALAECVQTKNGSSCP